MKANYCKRKLKRHPFSKYKECLFRCENGMRIVEEQNNGNGWFPSRWESCDCIRYKVDSR